jgi:hypothetical protein
MTAALSDVLQTLRTHQNELRRLGVSHAAVFGSVARGEASADSDIDVLVELDEDRSMGIFEYARLKLYINQLLDGADPSRERKRALPANGTTSCDVVNRRTLKPCSAITFCATRPMPSKNPAQRLRVVTDAFRPPFRPLFPTCFPKCRTPLAESLKMNP